MTSDNNEKNTNEPRPELFGLHHTNQDTVLTKNVFTTFFPISTTLFLASKKKPVKYLRINDGKLDVTTISLGNAIGSSDECLKDIQWNGETHPALFNNSANPPSMDMVPVLNDKELLEFEVKLTVVPTFNRQKITEMIVRQNTQFSLAERLAYRHRELVDVRPVTVDTLRNILGNEECQLPFILHGLWKTVGDSSVIDKHHSTDVFFISDFAYLKILVDKLDGDTGGSGRVSKVMRLIRTWVGNYIENGTMRYREKGSKC